jgi:DNA-binding MarR family transcriptional regulator
VFAEHGLSRDAFDVLAALRRSGPPYELSPTDLYYRLMRTSGAVTNRLHRLESAGLVARAPDPRDGRGAADRAWPQARRRRRRAAPRQRAPPLAALSPQEQRTLARLLRKLLLSIEDDRGGRQPPTEGRRAPG